MLYWLWGLSLPKWWQTAFVSCPLRLICSRLTIFDQYFFNNTDFTNQVADISSACSTAMQASIACDPYLRDVITSNYYGPVGTADEQDSFCNPSCGSGLSTYRSAVLRACSNDPDPLPGLPATYWVDSATAAWTQLCLKDSLTGSYCVGQSAIFFIAGNFSSI